MPKAKVRRRPRRANPQVDVRINIVSIIIILVFDRSRRRRHRRAAKPGRRSPRRRRRVHPRCSRRKSRSSGSAPSCFASANIVGLRGPGLFWVIPFIETVSSWIDQRVITTNFKAEETLTSDTVPVNVDAVLFWMVYDPEKAALEVQDYARAVSWAAQTALRDIIGRTSLSDLLRGREHIEADLQKLIDER